MKTKWFDTKEIKNKEILTQGQIEYLLKPSITIFGPFNVLFRRHWDIFTATIVSGLVVGIIEAIFIPENIMIPNPDAPYYHLYLLLTSIPSYVLAVPIIYFGVRHGRRLSWNRGKWSSVEDLEKSEEKWDIISWIFLVLTVLRPLILLLGSIRSLSI